MKPSYELHIPPKIALRMGQLRASVRREIRIRLEEILQVATARPLGALLPPLGPPLRFYAGDFRIFYREEPETRRVVVTELRSAFA